MASSQSAAEKGRAVESAPTSTTFVLRGLPTSRAICPAGIFTAPSPSKAPSTSSGISKVPMATLTGTMTSSFTKRVPPSRRNSCARSASIDSKATTTSAQPGSATIESTFLPMRTTVETEPPRWLMPWISETLTSSPASAAAMARRDPARIVPWPPTPTSRTVSVPSTSTFSPEAMTSADFSLAV